MHGSQNKNLNVNSVTNVYLKRKPDSSISPVKSHVVCVIGGTVPSLKMSDDLHTPAYSTHDRENEPKIGLSVC